MATKLYRNKNLRRPRKSPTERARRTRDQRKRVVALGLSEEKVARMNEQELRKALRRPVKTAKSAAK